VAEVIISLVITRPILPTVKFHRLRNTVITHKRDVYSGHIEYAVLGADYVVAIHLSSSFLDVRNCK
jgi:hypothetical protein